MKLEDKIKEAHQQKNEMVTQLQQLRQAVVQNETAVVKLIGKIEGLQEALIMDEGSEKVKEKVSGAK